MRVSWGNPAIIRQSCSKFGKNSNPTLLFARLIVQFLTWEENYKRDRNDLLTPVQSECMISVSAIIVSKQNAKYSPA